MNPIKTTYLKDYSPPDYWIEDVDLTFDFQEELTQVSSRLVISKNTDKKDNRQDTLILHGEGLELVSLKINQTLVEASEYHLDDKHLTLKQVPDQFVLEAVTRIKPRENTSLQGLYGSRKVFCTQCEPEGFRRITYFLDRPDVLSSYRTTLIADKTRYPVLLSNGNLVQQGELPDNRHWVTWEDPFKKPCYLFALVAGDLAYLEDHFVTMSGRSVTLRIFSEPGEQALSAYAMTALKQAMAWDEKAYGREYDLSIFMIVAIHDFNSGAMENKGLNLFNAKYILANPETATDSDYENILAVVAHEYFHNWTGNRVTCRDWFQLSLKEGLTVFREQEFVAEATSATVSRIAAVKQLRQIQFEEDAGPLAHPVQPDAYIAINNFYTMTVYEKGAEVIRMIKTLIGEKLFRCGMDLYFTRHDGQATTIENFLQAMQDVSHCDLTQFKLWYYQAGTPVLNINSHYDPQDQSLTLTVAQSCPATPGQKEKKPFHLPLVMGLLSASGQELSLQKTLKGAGHTLEIKQAQESFTLTQLPDKPVVSLLRGFSAPVKMVYDYSDEELSFLFKNDTDDFNRWEAGQQLVRRVLFRCIEDAHANIQVIVDLLKSVLTEGHVDKFFMAELMILPSEADLAGQMTVIDVDGIHRARDFLRTELAKQLRDLFLFHYRSHASAVYSHDRESIGRRHLKNTCLAYLMLLDEPDLQNLCLDQFRLSDNMTDVFSALASLVNRDSPHREESLNAFYQRWKHDALVMDKWLSVQASCRLPGNLQRVQALMTHSVFDFNNPNKVRALIGTFCNHNLVQFHDKSGSGYAFLAEQVLKLDALNPQIAARLLNPMTGWKHYDEQRQQHMRAQLEKIAAVPTLSKNTHEVVAKSLNII